MPLDDAYVPQPKRSVPITEPRVMRLEEVHDSDRIAIERAIRRLRPELSDQVVDAQVVDAEAYCYDRAALTDFRRMAQINADVTGRCTYLHVHGIDEPCIDPGRANPDGSFVESHFTFHPDPRRTVAVGGPSHS